jgi:succinate dehydrogenase / fumarate reductase iron-sulfur subunit
MGSKQVTFRVKRFDPETKESWTQEYPVPVSPGMTVLEGLWHIVRYIDGGLSFRYSCRGAVCGSCAMSINKSITLACHTQIASLDTAIIDIEPLPRMEVLKDLVVDMEDFLRKFRSIDPFLITANATDKEIPQSPKDRKKIEKSVRCILCTSCHAACPLTATHEEYLGPAVLTAGQRFASDSRNDRQGEAIEKIDDPDGVWTCRTISRCTEVCPKNIEPSIRIKALKETIRSREKED